MAPLDKASIIAVCSVAGFIGLVILVAFINYCYRRHEIEVRQKQKAAAKLNAYQNGHYKGHFVQNNFSKSPTRSPHPVRVVPVPSRPIQRRGQVYNTTTSVPGHGFYHVTKAGQPNMSSKGFFVHSMGGKHMVHQVPIRSLVPQSFQVYQSRPMMRRPVPDFTYDMKQHGTAPPLRLGAYKPKVITDYFSPHNIRETFNDSPAKSNIHNESPSAVYEKEGYSGYKDRGQSWYSKQTEVMVGTIDFKDEDDQSKAATNSERETPKHEPNTESSSYHERQNLQHANSETNTGYKAEEYSFVIVDYLSETLKSNKSSHITGPLTTSTPRYVEQTLRIPRQDSDSGVESLETNKRQRHPNEGSIEDLPYGL